MHSVIIPTQACHPTLPYQPPQRCVLTNSRPTHDNLTKKKCEAKIEKMAAKLPTHDRTRETKFKNARSRPESMYFLRK